MLFGSSGTRRQCVRRGGAGNQCLLLAESRRSAEFLGDLLSGPFGASASDPMRSFAVGAFR